jgi:hypothetical protein
MKPRRDLMILVAAVGVSAGGDIGAIAALAVHVQESTHSGPTGWRSRSLRRPAGRSSIAPTLAFC